MNIKANFYIEYHKQLLREALEHAYKNEYIDFDISKGKVAPIIFQNKELSEEDIHYILKILETEGYITCVQPHFPTSFKITDKGRIFYLTTFW